MHLMGYGVIFEQTRLGAAASRLMVKNPIFSAHFV